MPVKPPKAKKTGMGRVVKTRVKTAKGRKISSTLWLDRQLNDPFVQQSKRDGYRSRAAYKLLQLDEQFSLLKPGQVVVDLGAAPGSWTQVAAQKIKAGEHHKACVVGLDLLEISPLPGAQLLQMDFLAPDAPEAIIALLPRKADVVLSDMAPSTTGHSNTDHVRIMALCEAAFAFAREILAPGGAFVAKVFQGGTERELLNELRLSFSSVKHAKPKASRADSSELYVVATGFRGA